jgi:hypothetical protein
MRSAPHASARFKRDLHSSRSTKTRLIGGSSCVVHVVLSDAGTAAIGICDERGRECKQTDCEHDQRAVQ